jgi:hypothetical protein
MGSTNESTWTVIDTQTSITTWTSATPKTFIPAVNSGLYNYLRLVVGSIGNLTSGGSNQDIVQISTLSFTGSTGSIVFSGTGAITFS